MNNNNTKEKNTVLVVDDIEINIDIMMAILKDCDVIPATSGKDALSLLEEEHVDLILLDLLMPGMGGFETCRKLKSNPATQDIPVIFITVKNDEESIEEAYAIGGVDYVTKPFKPRELRARVLTQLKMQELIKELDYLATRDSLTGLYNRRKFFELGQRMFQDTGFDVFALMLDLDHFKRINDQYGHHTGDVTLKQITTTISNLLPDESVFGRMGGEEFAILIQSSSQQEVMDVAEKIRSTVSELKIEDGLDDFFICTISTGVAKKNENTTKLEVLLMEADAALYQAKSNGRNRSIIRAS